VNPREHIAAALDFLDLADHPIALQNRLLRSEILWCAAAHAVKAVGKQRGWRNESHDDLFHIAGNLARNLGNDYLRSGFRSAGRLHRNMYEGRMNDRDIARDQGRVRRLVYRLEALVN
jgi:hypothetical protein